MVGGCERRLQFYKLISLHICMVYRTPTQSVIFLVVLHVSNASLMKGADNGEDSCFRNPST